MTPNNGDKLFEFIQSNFNILSSYYKSSYNNAINNTDVFITGNDQIWNVKHKFDPFMFLNFAKDKKRIAYVSSIGISYIPQEYKSIVKELLSKFSHIGVRERVAVDALSNLLERNDVVQVLDPTFLLTAYEWKVITRNIHYEIKIPDKFILCYFIGNNIEYVNQLNDVKEKTGIKKYYYHSFS